MATPSCHARHSATLNCSKGTLRGLKEDRWEKTCILASSTSAFLRPGKGYQMAVLDWAQGLALIMSIWSLDPVLYWVPRITFQRRGPQHMVLLQSTGRFWMGPIQSQLNQASAPHTLDTSRHFGSLWSSILLNGTQWVWELIGRSSLAWLDTPPDLVPKNLEPRPPLKPERNPSKKRM